MNLKKKILGGCCVKNIDDKYILLNYNKEHLFTFNSKKEYSLYLALLRTIYNQYGYTINLKKINNILIAEIKDYAKINIDRLTVKKDLIETIDDWYNNFYTYAELYDY